MKKKNHPRNCGYIKNFIEFQNVHNYRYIKKNIKIVEKVVPKSGTIYRLEAKKKFVNHTGIIQFHDFFASDL